MVRVRAHVLGGVVEARATRLALGPGLSSEADGDAAARVGVGEVSAGHSVPEATDRGAGDREAVVVILEGLLDRDKAGRGRLVRVGVRARARARARVRVRVRVRIRVRG